MPSPALAVSIFFIIAILGRGAVRWYHIVILIPLKSEQIMTIMSEVVYPVT